MDALEKSKQDLAEALQKVAIIEQLKKTVKKHIESIWMISETAHITIEAMTTAEAIQFISTLKLITLGTFKGYGVKPVTPYYIKQDKNYGQVVLPYAMEFKKYSEHSESLQLFGFIKVKGTLVEINIPITDNKEKLASYHYRGSTSRSKVTGMTVDTIPDPFNKCINWGSIHTAYFYKV